MSTRRTEQRHGSRARTVVASLVAASFLLSSLLVPSLAIAAPPRGSRLAQAARNAARNGGGNAVRNAGPEAATESSGGRDQAAAAFKEGTKLVGETRWAEALAAFERAQVLVPHAITQFNVGVCERALGRYTAARRTFRLALAEHASKRTVLPSSLEQDAIGYLREIDGLLARVRVSIEPVSATIAVDGRPLEIANAADSSVPVLVAGLSAPGKGAPVPSPTFELEMDYGRHVLTFSRPGHSDAIVAKDFAPGRSPALTLALDELPATIEVSADQPGSIVTVDGRDFGPVPVVLQRPAGSYRVVVEKDGFLTAESQLDVRAGESSSFRATLPVDEPSVVESWWFWTIAAGAAVGIGVGTYFATREEPAPERATVGAGTLGWRVPLP